jgi:archaellum component FlaC
MKLLVAIAKFVFHTTKRLENKRNLKLKKESIDFENIHQSFDCAAKLHRELITTIHPDKFSDDNGKDFANEMSSLVNVNKHNYKELIKLQELITNHLNK